MKWILLLLMSTTLFAQDEAPPPAEEPVEAAETTETEEQQSTRAVSLRDLEEADDALDKEREALVKSERRISQLLEDLENKSQALAGKEDTLKQMLAQNASTDDDGPFAVPQQMVDYWDKRVPSVAAKDFALLFEKDPKVCINIVMRMKKKNSARLIDEVNKLDGNGIRIAALLNEAVGRTDPANP